MLLGNDNEIKTTFSNGLDGASSGMSQKKSSLPLGNDCLMLRGPNECFETRVISALVDHLTIFSPSFANIFTIINHILFHVPTRPSVVEKAKTKIIFNFLPMTIVTIFGGSIN